MTTKKTAKFESAHPNSDAPDVQDVTPEDLHRKLDQVHLIDVRQPDEYTGELGHIAGAKLIVLNTLPEHLDELPKDETIVFICRSGGRSARATMFALQAGLKDVYNMKGGMLRWNALGYATEGKSSPDGV